MVRRLVIASMLLSLLTVVPSGSRPAVAVSDIDYTTILNECENWPQPRISCWLPPTMEDILSIVLTECSPTFVDNCYTATVNDKPAPANLKFLALMVAGHIHSPTVDNAQFESQIAAYYVPPGGALHAGDTWWWSKRPSDQTYGDGKMDLSPVLQPTDRIKIVLKYRTPSMPQWSVLVAEKANMDFKMSGQSLTLTIEGSPTRVALESADQHINYDTERSDDLTLPWTNKCGIPNMRQVVCNIDKAETNPLLFYSRSSTFVNPPGSESPAPFWVSTNATYFHQPFVDTQPNGARFVKVLTAAPHFLADGTTVNEANVRFFVPNAILETYKINLTDAALNSGVGVLETKNGVERWLAIKVTKTPLGALIELPPTTYSSPALTIKPMQSSLVVIKTKKYGKKRVLTRTKRQVVSLAGVPGKTVASIVKVKDESGKECYWAKKIKSQKFKDLTYQMPTKVYHCMLDFSFTDGTRLKLKVTTRRS